MSTATTSTAATANTANTANTGTTARTDDTSQSTTATATMITSTIPEAIADGIVVPSQAQEQASVKIASSPPPLRLTEGIHHLLSSTDAFIFDCDGVIWKGGQVIEGVRETLLELRKAGKRVFFITNNSMLSRKALQQKFINLDLQVEYDEILSASFAAALVLKEYHPLKQGEVAYVIGHDGITEELDLMHIPHIGGQSMNTCVPSFVRGSKVEYANNVGAVIVGLDLNINYYKLQYAQLCLNNVDKKDCLFVATNPDAVEHVTDAQEWSGGGCIVSAVQGCTNKVPIVAGKPSSYLLDFLCKTHGVVRERVCMVGDRLDTDIMFGRRYNMRTILTLSGVTTKETMLETYHAQHNIYSSGSSNHDAKAAAVVAIPEYYVNSIKDFFAY